jgi:hypothetical protein
MHRVCDIAAGGHHSLVAVPGEGCWGFGTNSWWQLGLLEAKCYNTLEPVPAPCCKSWTGTAPQNAKVVSIMGRSGAVCLMTDSGISSLVQLVLCMPELRTCLEGAS